MSQWTSIPPWSNFFVTVNKFLHLLLEVSSDNKKRDCNQMLLQALCLACLSNMLTMNRSSAFFIKAIYMDCHYCVAEHMLYHKQGSLNKVVTYNLLIVNVMNGWHLWKVEYVQRHYHCTDKQEMFMFIFHLYNFFHLMWALNENISTSLSSMTSSLEDKMCCYPSMSTVKHGLEDMTSIPSKWKD